jgi:hypothetical protein
MDEQTVSAQDAPLGVHLEVYLDREPVAGRLRAPWGANEQFVGWLGFVEALRRLHDQRPAADSS